MFFSVPNGVIHVTCQNSNLNGKYLGEKYDKVSAGPASKAIFHSNSLR